MKNYSFDVGQKAKVIGVQDGAIRLVGEVGIVRSTVPDYASGYILLEFPERLKGIPLHSGHGLCPQSRGFFFEKRHIIPLPNKEIQPDEQYEKLFI